MSATKLTTPATRQAFAQRITSAWRKTAEHIFETGRCLIEAKQALPHGEWEKMFDAQEIPVTLSMAQRLMKIAANRTLSKAARVQDLPAAWGTLYELTKLPEPVLRDRLADGTVNAQTERSHVTRWQREVSQADRAHAVEPIAGTYRVIYADPPWQYGNSGLDQYGHAERHYLTMSTDDLCARDTAADFASQIRAAAQDNAVLFLWATSPMLPDALRVIEAWGFDYKAQFVWDKLQHNYGHYNSVRHELLLVATRGSCLPDIPKLYPSVVSLKRGEHSEKPEWFRTMIDALYPTGARIELFARGDVPDNWHAWGNQTSAVTLIYYEDLDADQLAWLEREPPPDEIAAKDPGSRRDIFRWCRWAWARKAAAK